MGGYTKKNLRSEVENQAPRFGMPPELDARFARTLAQLDTETYTSRYEEGQAFTLNEACAFALEGTEALAS